MKKRLTFLPKHSKPAKTLINKDRMREAMKKHSNQETPQLNILKKELKRERYKRRFRRLLRSTINALIVVAAVAALVATLVLPVLQIAGTSMEPSLTDGNIVLLVKKNKLDTGDLCAFYFSNKILIKRVIAAPGDYIWIEPDGSVYLNGSLLDEPYVSQKALGECDVEFPYQVPENSYFVMGDHRETSIDSRSSVIGCIAQDQIVGKIFCKFWPLSEFTFLN